LKSRSTEEKNNHNQEKPNNTEDNPNQQPTNQEEEQNNPPPTQQQPLIDTAKIEQIENIQEAITTIKNQIQQVLKDRNLKTSDLPTKYQN
jgi:3-oxoacyl-[acyl-carrier-protein] synthase III